MTKICLFMSGCCLVTFSSLERAPPGTVTLHLLASFIANRPSSSQVFSYFTVLLSPCNWATLSAMASTIGSLNALAINSGDIVDLVSSSASATIYPNDDSILSALHARFRADLPYTRIGTSNLVVVNPYKTLANVNDASAREYEERCYKDTGLPLVDSPKPLQPHVYEMAAKIYLLMRRRNMSQAVITRCVAIFSFLYFH